MNTLTSIEERKEFTLADFINAIETIQRLKTEPPTFLISVETLRQLRIFRLYTANPLPRRKLRKYFARKRQAAMSKGKRRLIRR